MVVSLTAGWAGTLLTSAFEVAGRGAAVPPAEVRRAKVTFVLAGRPRAASIAARDCGSTAGGQGERVSIGDYSQAADTRQDIIAVNCCSRVFPPRRH